jgi:predicted naringenin-chalcone synthase
MKFLIAIFVLISTNASATTEFSCAEVKALVILAGGEANAESIARSQGLSEEIIKRAKDCLKEKHPGDKPGR